MVVDCSKAFTTLVCESIRDNEIDLTVSAAALVLVFRHVGASLFCAMRLTKRGSEPVLRFEFNFADSGNCLVVHDVPVEILRSELIWSEPVLPDPDTRLIMTHSTRKLWQCLERLKQMGVADVQASFIDRAAAMDLRITGACDSVKTTVFIPNQSVFGHQATALAPTQLDLTLTGLSFVFGRASAVSETSRCVLMSCNAKYLSAWIQLPNQYGSLAAVTPAIFVN